MLKADINDRYVRKTEVYVKRTSPPCVAHKHRIEANKFYRLYYMKSGHRIRFKIIDKQGNWFEPSLNVHRPSLNVHSLWEQDNRGTVTLEQWKETPLIDIDTSPIKIKSKKRRKKGFFTPNSTFTSNTKEGTKTMPMKITTPTLINGEDSAEMDDGTLIHHIQNLEKKIVSLNQMKAHSKKVQRMIVDHASNINKLVDILDSRD